MGKIWQPDFTIARFGRTYIFHPEMMIGPDAEEEQLIILLDNRYMYEIFVHETNLFILNENCCVLPSTYVRLIPNVSSSSNIYYRISATQHQELTRPKDPCVVDDQYNFFSLCEGEHCPEGWMSTKLGYLERSNNQTLHQDRGAQVTWNSNLILFL